jgi:hypothetical protein
LPALMKRRELMTVWADWLDGKEEGRRRRWCRSRRARSGHDPHLHEPGSVRRHRRDAARRMSIAPVRVEHGRTGLTTAGVAPWTPKRGDRKADKHGFTFSTGSERRALGLERLQSFRRIDVTKEEAMIVAVAEIADALRHIAHELHQLNETSRDSGETLADALKERKS